MAISDAVSRSELERHLLAVSKTVRLSGTPGEAAAFDYVEHELRAFGFTVNRYHSEALIGYPLRSTLHVTSPAPIEIRCNGYALTPPTPGDGIDGELIFTGSSLETNYDGFDCRGKIVVVDGIAIEDAALAAANAGAIGQIFINPEYIHEMCISPVWGTPDPETAHLLPSVPAVGIARADGERLRTLAADGPVRVRLMSQPYKAWTSIPTLIAELPGKQSDDFVLFSGHIDSWHYGAMDNGTANATQLEVARLLAGCKDELRRGVRLAFWSGHSHGRYAGSTWYADTFWHDLHERCVAHVNVDSVGAKGATILDSTSSMASTFPFAKSVIKQTVNTELGYHRKSRSSDQSFWGHGVPSLFGALSLRPGTGDDAGVAEIFGGVSLGWWWHTTEDLVDKIDPAFFQRDARVYAETLWRLCTEERLAWDPAAEVDEIAAALSRYGDAARGSLDLSATIALAESTASAIRGVDWELFPAAVANRSVMDLCRTLIPVNYTARGPFHHDLAVETKPLPGLMQAGKLAELDAGSDAWHFLRASLIRERNRVEHALRLAGRQIP